VQWGGGSLAPLYPTECGAAAAAMVKLNRVCETQPPSVGVNVYCSCGLRAALPPPRLATSSRLHAHINNRQHEKGWMSCVNADNCQSQTSTTTDSAWLLETQSKCLTCSDAGLAGAEKAVAASQTERFKCACLRCDRHAPCRSPAALRRPNRAWRALWPSPRSPLRQTIPATFSPREAPLL
jgi:hypothetical protein